MRLDPAVIRLQIQNLTLQYPELEEDEQLRADMIEGSTEAHEFLRTVERLRQEASVLASAIAGNIAELGLRQSRFERREQAMRTLMFKVLQLSELRKVELPEATLSIRNGTHKLIITDESAIPPELFRVKREPDKAAIKVLLVEGCTVDGCTLSNAEPTLSIRTK